MLLVINLASFLITRVYTVYYIISLASWDFFLFYQSVDPLANISFVDLLEHIDDERAKFFFPVSADLNGAAVALVRLQDLYNMNMRSLSNGVIKRRYTHGNKGDKKR